MPRNYKCCVFSVCEKASHKTLILCIECSDVCLKESTDLRDLLIVAPSSKFSRLLYIVHFLCAGTAVAPFIVRAWFSCRSSLVAIHSFVGR